MPKHRLSVCAAIAEPAASDVRILRSSGFGQVGDPASYEAGRDGNACDACGPFCEDCMRIMSIRGG